MREREREREHLYFLYEKNGLNGINDTKFIQNNIGKGRVKNIRKIK